MNKSPHRLAVATAIAALALVVAGSLVTSTRSGMATEDPVRMDGGFAGTKLYEHAHRIAGWAVGLLTLLTTLTVGLTEKRAWARKLAIAALAAVVAQGLLGMLTVRLQLPPAVSIAHAGLAEITFAILVALAVVTAPSWTPAVDRRGLAAAALVLAQIVLGAWYRHTGMTAAAVAHVAGALAVGAFAFLWREARLLQVLFFAQILLGPLALALRNEKTVFAAQPEPLAYALPMSAHLAVGALMMAASVWYLLRAPREAKQPALATA